MAPTRAEDTSLAFVVKDGKKISNARYRQMQEFLQTDTADAFGRSRGARQLFYGNFLNDGVVQKDFLESGLALLLFEHEQERFAGELGEKVAREKEFRPYVHPQMRQVSAKAAWAQFAPGILDHLASTDSFESRVHLYLAQRSFPPIALRQALRFQERQHEWLESDAKLPYLDLSLFGYRDLRDWFGPTFLQVVAKTIFQGAAEARQLGYRVTHPEILAFVGNKSQETFRVVKDRLPIPIESAGDYLNQFLRSSGWNEQVLLDLVGDILLFRRWMHDVGTATVVDALPFEEFYRHANAFASLEVIRMPKPFSFTTYNELQEFEVYLHAVTSTPLNSLELSLKLDPLQVIENRAPELVARKYLLEISSVTREDLLHLVSLKELLEWEVEADNYAFLRTVCDALPEGREWIPEERFTALEELDRSARKRVDHAARLEILKLHPDWAEKSLANASLEMKELKIASWPTKQVLPGIDDPFAFIDALVSSEECTCFTQDDEHYYRFRLTERQEEMELLSFEEAAKEGILEVMLTNRLEQLHHILQKEEPGVFGSSFSACRKKVADRYFGTLLESLYECAYQHELLPQGLELGDLGPRVAPHRFLPLLASCEEDSFQASVDWAPILDDWIVKRSDSESISYEEAMRQESGVLSRAHMDESGLFFYRKMVAGEDMTMPIDKLLQAQKLLGHEARLHLFREWLDEWEI